MLSSDPSESPMLGQHSSDEVDSLSIEAGDVEDLPPSSLVYRSSWGLCFCCSQIKYMARCKAGTSVCLRGLSFSMLCPKGLLPGVNFELLV